MFSWKGAPLKMGPQEGLVFYVSTAEGEVYSCFYTALPPYCSRYHYFFIYSFYSGKVHNVDEHCKSSTLLSVEGSIKKLFYLDKREALCVITDTLMLSQYTLRPEGGAQEFMKVYSHHQWRHFYDISFKIAMFYMQITFDNIL